MYKLSIFLLISICISTAISQPKLIEAFPDQQISIDIGVLKEMPDLYSFEKENGVILYDELVDGWTFYNLIQGYENLGVIKSINRLSNILIISLEQGSLIINNDQIVQLSTPVSPIGILNEKLICLPDQFMVNKLLSYDISSGNLKEIELEKRLYGVIDLTFDESSLWIATMDTSSPDYWYKGFSMVTLDGKVTNMEGIHEKRIHSVFNYKNEIMIVNSNGVFSITSEQTLKLKKDIQLWESFNTRSNITKTSFLYKDPNAHSISYKSIDHGSLETETFDLNYEIALPYQWSFSDFIQINGSIYCLVNDVILGINSKEQQVKRYTYKSGRPMVFQSIVEDEREVWFLSINDGLTKYSKENSTWKSYPVGLDIKEDSVNFLYQRQLTMNEDYVFVTLTPKNYSRIKKYLILNRKTEEACVLTKEQLVRKFFNKGAEFVKYDGTPICSNEELATVESIFHKMHEWEALLYFYDLPLEGINYYDQGYKIISNELSKMILIRMRWSDSSWPFYGVLYNDKNTNAFKAIKFPNHPNKNREFWDMAGSSNYRIAGSKEQLFVTTRDDNPKGVIKLNLNTGEYQVKSIEFNRDFSRGFSLFGQLENHLLMGGYRGELYALASDDNSVTNFGRFRQVRGAHSSSKYHYVSTDDHLLYFDKDFKLLGDFIDPKFSGGGARTYFTSESVYVVNGNGLFRVME